jgi:hypothetical protein
MEILQLDGFIPNRSGPFDFLASGISNLLSNLYTINLDGSFEKNIVFVLNWR